MVIHNQSEWINKLKCKLTHKYLASFYMYVHVVSIVLVLNSSMYMIINKVEALSQIQNLRKEQMEIARMRMKGKILKMKAKQIQKAAQL